MTAVFLRVLAPVLCWLLAGVVSFLAFFLLGYRLFILPPRRRTRPRRVA